MESVTFVPFEEGHMRAVLDIYNHYVLNTTVSFHCHPLSEDGMRNELHLGNDRYGTFTIIINGAVSGYVVLSPYKAREAYSHTGSISIYLHPEKVGRGVGTRAIAFIEGVAVERGIKVLVPSHCGENGASARLFTKCGYVKCGHFKNVGQKFGRYLDVVAYMKALSPDL